MAAGKVTENAKKYIKQGVLGGKTYAQVAEEIADLYGIEISKQAVSYYVGKMGLRGKLAQVREHKRKEQEEQWKQALVAWVGGLGEDEQVTLCEAAEVTDAPSDWVRDELIKMGAYDDQTFRERADDVDLMTRYIVDDMSLAQMHEAYYSDVCISTLTQTMRNLLYAQGLKPRPKSCANNDELRRQWRQETLDQLRQQGWTVSST